MIFANEEFSIVPRSWLCKYFNVASNTIYTIIRGKAYKDYALSYSKLSQNQKEKIVSLLRNQ